MKRIEADTLHACGVIEKFDRDFREGISVRGKRRKTQLGACSLENTANLKETRCSGPSLNLKGNCVGEVNY